MIFDFYGFALGQRREASLDHVGSLCLNLHQLGAIEPHGHRGSLSRDFSSTVVSVGFAHVLGHDAVAPSLQDLKNIVLVVDGPT
jgi:hypothetical protein